MIGGSEVFNEGQKRPKEPLFSSFFMGGFECSTHRLTSGRRLDLIAATGHDRFVAQDYRRLIDCGMRAARDGVRWHLIEASPHRYDFSSALPMIRAARDAGVQVVWDLCHYGWPDRISPLDDGCLERFVDYCHAAAGYVVAHTDPPRYFTPVNEIKFTAGAATDMGWFFPYAKGKYPEMLTALCRMAIEGAKAIREIDPNARMVHVDPLIHTVPPPGRDDLADDAWKEAYEDAYEAWDVLAGKKQPELGGSPEILDVVGVNIYHFSQAQMNADKTREVLGPRDPRRRPLGELLQYAWERYQRPIIIGETSGYQDKRAEWLGMVMEESLRALNSGIDLQGVCLYPCVDIPDWQSGELAKIGLYDLCDMDECERVPCEAYVDELRRWQHILHRAEKLEPDPAHGTARDVLEGTEVRKVQLEEVRQHAREWEARTAGRQTVDGDR